MRQYTMADYMKQAEKLQKQYYRYMASGTLVVNKNMVEMALRNYAVMLSANYGLSVDPATINVVVLPEEPQVWRHCCGAGGIQVAQPICENYMGVDIKFILCNYCHKLLYYADYTNAIRIDKNTYNEQSDMTMY